jgi:hypothetical protein
MSETVKQELERADLKQFRRKRSKCHQLSLQPLGGRAPRRKENSMNNEDWHYLWIKTLVEHGMTVESAETAFKERYDINDLLADRDPVQSAELYLEQHAASVNPAGVGV